MKRIAIAAILVTNIADVSSLGAFRFYNKDEVD
jgi:hypothetical protein